MAEAARSARGAFTDIKTGAGEMAAGAGESFLNTRAALGILDNSIRGNHAAAMADLIRLFRESAAVQAALPFAATAGGVLLLAGVVVGAIKVYKEWREEQEKLKGEQTEFGTAIQTTFNGLDEKLISAGIRADELRNDHLGALRGELALIDKQSMDELIRAFGEIDKAAEALFGDLKSHWYTFGIGSAGASHALSQFKTQYDALIAQGKDGAAGDLLKGDARERATNPCDAKASERGPRKGRHRYRRGLGRRDEAPGSRCGLAEGRRWIHRERDERATGARRRLDRTSGRRGAHPRD
jgi:hypothetical protein